MGIVNLIIAVICDAISGLNEEEKANLHGQYDSDSDEGSGSGSSRAAPKLELREQLDSLEDQMVNITRIQARTFHTLQYLTQQLRTQKEAKEKANQLEKEGTGTSIPPFSRSNNNNNNSKDDDERDSNKETSSSKPTRFLRRGASMNSITRTNNNNGNNKNKNNKRALQNNRVNYTETWTQQGSQKALRRASVSHFAQAARELQKVRDEEE